MINIYNDIPYLNKDIKDQIPSIKPYIIEDDKIHPAMIILPGGGYYKLADHEGEPIAKWLNSIGINAFVLSYRIKPYMYPAPLLDIKRAIRFVRYYSEKFKINENKVGVLGFSAGGHLAASLCVDFDYGNKDSDDKIERVSCRPDISILCYPVISFLKYVHEGSKENLLGTNPSTEIVYKMSVETQVKKNTPPTFIWTTAEDKTVPMENSLLYVKALKEKGIPLEFHIFPKGRHGLGLKDEVPYVMRWAKLCQDWFNEQNFI